MWKNLNTKIVNRQMSGGKKDGGNENKANAEFNIYVEIILHGNLCISNDVSLCSLNASKTRGFVQRTSLRM